MLRLTDHLSYRANFFVQSKLRLIERIRGKKQNCDLLGQLLAE